MIWYVRHTKHRHIRNYYPMVASKYRDLTVPSRSPATGSMHQNHRWSVTKLHDMYSVEFANRHVPSFVPQIRQRHQLIPGRADALKAFMSI